MTLDLEGFSALSLEERNAALTTWLNDLTTVYEKCAAERDALRLAASRYIAFVDSYEPSSFLRRENRGLYDLLQAYADDFRGLALAQRGEG